MSHFLGRPKILIAAALGGLFTFAFIAARRPCEQALDTWALAGAGTLVALVTLSFLAPESRLTRSPLGSALIVALATAAVWTAGLFAADIRILCRLF